MIYQAIDIWNTSYLEHYGVKGMRWGHRKPIEQISNPYFRKYTWQYGDTGHRRRKSKPVKASTAMKVAAGIGGGLALYALSKRAVYSKAGMKDPKILSKTLKLTGDLAKESVKKIGPSLAKTTIKSMKAAMPSTISFLGKTARITKSKVIPAIIKPYSTAGKNLGSVVNKRIKNNGRAFAKGIISTTSMKVNGIDASFAASYISGLGKLSKKSVSAFNRRNRKNVKDIKKLDRNEWTWRYNL